MKVFYLILGWISLMLGIIGIPLPLLPTTPFLLLAAFCFSKGSERLHTWLTSHPKLGPVIRDWETSGVIRKPAKIKATLLMLLLFSYTLIFVPVALWIKLIVTAIGIGSLTFIWTRPDGSGG